MTIAELCRLLSRVLLTFGLTAAVATVASDAALSQETPVGAAIAPGEVNVRYKPTAARASRPSVRAAVGGRLMRTMLLPNTELIIVPVGQEEEAAAALARNPNVLFAIPNRISHADASPNDARFTHLWGLHNTGQAVNGVAGTADGDIDAPEAWNLVPSGAVSSVRVAVVDTGITFNHPDLVGNIFINPGEFGPASPSGQKHNNGVDDDGNGFIDDWRGWDFANDDNDPIDDRDHGTHVAGTIAARANNALGVAGVASFPKAGGWNGVKIIPIKVLDENGSGTEADIADGFVYAGLMSAKVANASLSGSGVRPLEDAAMRGAPNTLFVMTAGNNGEDVGDFPRGPCVSTAPEPPNKLCVAATDSKDQLASFSNFDDTHVDLAAPGVDILSTFPRNVLIEENFERPVAGRWTHLDSGQVGTQRWTRVNAHAFSGDFTVADSPVHATNNPNGIYEVTQDNWLRHVTPLDFTGGTGCRMNLRYFVDRSSGDVFTVETTTSLTGTPVWTVRFTGGALGPGNFNAVPSFSALDGQASVYVRLRFKDNGDATVDDGYHVDDVLVSCAPGTFKPTAYRFLDGTSMAAPHVAGAAAFLFTKFPTANVATIKNKIMRSVDKKPGLTGKMVSGGRLNLYKAGAESTALIAGGILRWTAGIGEINNVQVVRFIDAGVPRFRIGDPYSVAPGLPQSGSRIVPGAGCVAMNDNFVKCNEAGVGRIVLSGNDQNDTFNAATIAKPLTVDGGAGNDLIITGSAPDILIGNLGADRFIAGGGNDWIYARLDDLDLSFNCGESASDTDRVAADLTPNDPVAASATNCEVVSKQ